MATRKIVNERQIKSKIIASAGPEITDTTASCQHFLRQNGSLFDLVLLWLCATITLGAKHACSCPQTGIVCGVQAKVPEIDAMNMQNKVQITATTALHIAIRDDTIHGAAW
eukprot:3743656-Rhodomonas_salina.2